VTVVLGACAGLEPWRLVVLGLAMLLDQASVGLSNDWLDADRDAAVGRTDKPVAQGLIGRGAVRTAAITAAAAALALTIPLGWAALGAHSVALASAWSYNAVVKRTPLSVLPFVVSFGLLPVIATLSRTEPRPAAWWVVIAAALLGIAAHIANVLPDLDDDATTGVRGLPHRMGRPAAGVTVAVALAVAAALVALGPGLTVVGTIGLATSAALAVATVALVLRPRVSRWAFRLILLAAIVDVVLVGLAGSAIIS
jgi:4-hydroxybenzoate polyprenyltransferase